MSRLMSEITVEKALEILHDEGSMMGRKILCAGIEQGVFPFGVCVRLEQREYIVYENVLRDWIDERRMEYQVMSVSPELLATLRGEKNENIS